MGEREPVLLVHGLAGSSRWWRRVVAELEPGYDVRLVDLPRLDPAGTASWLGEWIAEAGLERVSLVGHSRGGLVAARLAAERPDLVRRLVLVAPAGVRPHASALAYALPLARTVVRSSPRFLAVLVRDAARAGPRTLWRAAQELLADDVRDDLHRIEAPMLLVWGERDRLVPPALAEVYRAQIPTARLLVLPRTGHVPMWERPRELAAAISAFLAGEPVGD